MPQAMLVYALPVEAMSGLALRLRAAEILLIDQIAVPHHKQAAVLAASLREIVRLVQPRQIHARQFADRRRILERSPAAVCYPMAGNSRQVSPVPERVEAVKGKALPEAQTGLIVDHCSLCSCPVLMLSLEKRGVDQIEVEAGNDNGDAPANRFRPRAVDERPHLVFVARELYQRNDRKR